MTGHRMRNTARALDERERTARALDRACAAAASRQLETRTEREVRVSAYREPQDLRRRRRS